MHVPFYSFPSGTKVRDLNHHRTMKPIGIVVAVLLIVPDYAMEGIIPGSWPSVSSQTAFAAGAGTAAAIGCGSCFAGIVDGYYSETPREECPSCPANGRILPCYYPYIDGIKVGRYFRHQHHVRNATRHRENDDVDVQSSSGEQNGDDEGCVVAARLLAGGGPQISVM